MYVAKSYEENSESSLVQQAASEELSRQPETTTLSSALNQPMYSHEPISYDAAPPRPYASGRTAECPNEEEEYTEPEAERQNVHYVNPHTYPLPVNKISPHLKDSYQPTSEDSYKLKDSFQTSRSENSYELDQSHQSITSEKSQKLKESYDPSIIENSETLTEIYQHTTLESPYKSVKEPYQISPSEDENEEHEDSKSKKSSAYYSFKSKISSNEDSIPSVQKEASSSRKYHPATGRETNPYTYFYVGRKLWYVPLFFSVYFMFYVLALVVKSISRHKIVFPTTKWSRDQKRDLNPAQMQLDEITHQVTTAVETTERLYM